MKKKFIKRSLLVAALTMSALSLGSVANAADLSISSWDDMAGWALSGNNGTLQNNITETSAAVSQIEADTILNMNNFTISGSSSFNKRLFYIGQTHSPKFTITGGGTIKDAVCSYDGAAIFLDKGVIETLSINFENNTSGQRAAAIANFGTIESITGNFTGNKAEAIGDTQGGAIYNQSNDGYHIGDISGNFTSNHASTTGDAATAVGGAIANISTGSEKGITGTISSNFTTNYVAATGNNGIAKGGALYNYQTEEMNISGATFTGNYATGATAQGGAIFNDYVAGGTMNISDTTFAWNGYDDYNGASASNAVTKEGGAIYNAANAVINFTGTNTFSNNAIKSGSDTVANDIYNAGTINVNSGTTTLNSGMVQDGGRTTVANGATFSVADGDFQNGSITSSTGDVYGGAIYNEGTITNLIADFTSNSATTTGATDDWKIGGGGAVYVDRIGSIDNIEGKFNQNSVTVSGSTDTNSARGGAIYVDGNDPNIGHIGTIEADFSYNSVTTSGIADDGNESTGGAISNEGQINSISGTFSYNSATASEADETSAMGGAIANLGNIGTISGEFEYNFAKASASASGAGMAGGGAIVSVDEIETIQAANFTGNYVKDSAISFGGAIMSNGDIDNIINSTFTGNYVESTGDEGYYGTDISAAGGAILNLTGSTTIKDTSFTNNTATSKGTSDARGGAIAQVMGTSTLAKDTGSGVTFTKNGVSATGGGNAFGGAIYNGYVIGESTITASNVSFIGNYAKNTDNTKSAAGGAIYNESLMNIQDASFAWNGYDDYNASAVGDIKATNAVTKEGGAIYNAANAVINFTGTNTFSNNAIKSGSDTVANDIYNEGTLNILGGTTTINGGISDAATPQGTINIGGTTDGTLTLGTGATLTQKALTVNSTGTLVANAANLNVTNGITNNGSLDFTNSTFNSIKNTNTLDLTYTTDKSFTTTITDADTPTGTTNIDVASDNTVNITVDTGNITQDKLVLTGAGHLTMGGGTIKANVKNQMTGNTFELRTTIDGNFDNTNGNAAFMGYYNNDTSTLEYRAGVTGQITNTNGTIGFYNEGMFDRSFAIQEGITGDASTVANNILNIGGNYNSTYYNSWVEFNTNNNKTIANQTINIFNGSNLDAALGSIANSVINIESNGILTANVSGLSTVGNTLSNNGELYLYGDGTNNNSITGSGTTEFYNDIIQADGKVIENAISIYSSSYTSDGSLTTNAGNIGGAVTLTVKGTNNSTLELTGGTLKKSVTVDGSGSGKGKVDISGATTLGTGGSIASEVVTTIGDALTVNGGELTLSNTDNLNAQTTLTSGTLNIIEIDENDPAGITANGGTLNISGDYTILNGHTSIADAVTTNINGMVEIKGATVGLNTGDGWNSDVRITSGNLTISGRTDTTGDTQTYDQSGGKLTLNGSSLKLATNASAITGGEVALTNTSTLNIANTLTNNTAKVSMADSGSELKITGNGTKFATATGTNITNGKVTVGNGTDASELTHAQGTIADTVGVTINSGSTLNINGGTATLNSGDTWYGDVQLNSGTLTVNQISKDSGAKLIANAGNLNIEAGTLQLNNSSDKIAETVAVDIKANTTLNFNPGDDDVDVTLNATGSGKDTWTGTLENNNTKTLVLKDFTGNNAKTGVFQQTSISAKTTVIGGFDMNNTSDKICGEFTVSSGDLNVSAGAISIAANSDINVVENVNVSGGSIEDAADLVIGGNMTITGGTVKYGGTSDSVSGKIIMPAESAPEVANAGTLKIVASTSTSTKLDVQGGTLNIQNSGTTLTVGDGSSDETISYIKSGADNAKVVIGANTTMDILKGGEVHLNGSEDWSKVDWDGTVALNGGELHLKYINSGSGEGYNKSGILNAQTGDLWIDVDTVTLFDDDIITKAVNIHEVGNVHLKTGSEMTIDEDDKWEGSTVYLEGGTLHLENTTTSASAENKLDAGVQTEPAVAGSGTGNLEILGTVTFGNEDVIANTVKTEIEEGNTLVLNDATVTLNGQNVGTDDIDTWTGNITVGKNGDLTLDHITKATSDTSKYNQSRGTLNLVESNLTLNAGSVITDAVITMDPSTLIFNNGEDNSAKITFSDESTLTIKGANTALTMLNGTDITDGTITVGDGTNQSKLTLSANSNISGGTGLIVLSNSILNSASNYIKVAVANNGTYNLTDGVVAYNIFGDNGVLNTSGNTSNSATINQKEINNSGTFTNTGDVFVSDATNNAGAIFNNNKNMTAENVTNKGTFSNGANANLNVTTVIDNEAGAVFTNNGLMSNTATDISNSGTFTNKGDLFADDATNNIAAVFTNEKNMTVTNITNQGTFTNAANSNLNVATLIENAAGAIFTNNGLLGNSAKDIFNAGTFTNGGELFADDATNNIAAIFTNEKNMTVTNITNKGTFTNGADANLNVATLITNEAGAIFTNEGIVNNNDLGILNKGTLTNGGDISTTDITNNAGAIFNNNKNMTVTNVGNYGTFTIGVDGVVNASDLITNNQGAVLTNNGLFSNTATNIANQGTLSNTGDIFGNFLNNEAGAIFTNEKNVTVTDLTNEGTFTNTADGLVVVHDTLTNSGNALITNNGTIFSETDFQNDVDGTVDGTGTLNVVSGINNGSITQGNMYIATDFGNTITGTMTITDTLTNDGVFTNLNTVDVTNADETALFDNNSETRITGGEITTDNLKNDDAKITLAQGTLNVTNQKLEIGSIAGTITASSGANNLSILGEAAAEEGTPSGQAFVGTLNIGTEVSPATLNFNAGAVHSSATVNILENSRLDITGAAANDSTDQLSYVSLNGNDVWNGEINVYNASGGNAGDGSIGLMLEGITKEIGIDSADYHQTGGSLVLKKDHTPEGEVGTTFKLDDSAKISGGHIAIDDASTYISGATTGYHNGFNVDMLYTAGMVDSMNGVYEKHTMNNLVAGNHLDNQADFTVDIYARSNTQKDYDQFAANMIGTASPSQTATINVADWTLHGDLFGKDAPIDRSIELPLFTGQIAEGHLINFTANPYKEYESAIGWYTLNGHSGGTYTLDLARFNPQVFRGQVATVAQMQNQLQINDMLFNHSMLVSSMKDQRDANKTASVSPLFAPYQYSVKDGGMWAKSYGAFENLQMRQGLNINNNSYGLLVGADFGLKELKHGWSFLPTAFVGYNGAHETFNGVSEYQNGGQMGFLGTFYKGDLILGGTAYGGVYDNHMSVAGHNEDTFNYFAGAALKAAYNWRFAKDWALQPNLLASYNFFGQQNWHANFGDMSMMAGMMNGINIAPGLNLIWAKDTFSIYGNIQYMYNINTAVTGSAGNVDLPNIDMAHGYIQYGLGVNKQFTNRASGYLEGFMRNVGRTGIGFQAGFNYALGKDDAKATQTKAKNETKKGSARNVNISATRSNPVESERNVTLSAK